MHKKPTLNRLLATFLALIALNSCKPSADSDTAGESTQASLRVNLVRPTLSSEPGSLNANGAIAARNLVLIGAELSGVRIQSMHVELGDWVKQDQLLAKLDDRVIQVELRQARAQRSAANASLATAQADAARGAVLRKKGLVSAREVEQVQAALLSAQAQLEIADAGVAAAALRLSFTEIRAPQKGWLSARHAQAGQLLSPGAVLFELIEDGELEWRAEVFERDLAGIGVGTLVEMQPAQSTSIGNPLLTGVVRSLGVEVDSAKRTVLVLVKLNLPGAGSSVANRFGLQAGSYASGRFILRAETLLTLPSDAIVERDGYSYVYTAQANPKTPGLSTVKPLRVEIVRRLGERIALAQAGSFAFDAEQAVVASGGGFLADGDRIEVVPEAAAPNNPDTLPSSAKQ